MGVTTIAIDRLRGWIGRREESRDFIAPAQAARMAALLDRPALAEGGMLPPLWHWIYFTPDTQQSQLGSEGYPKRGSFLPRFPCRAGCGPADASDFTRRCMLAKVCLAPARSHRSLRKVARRVHWCS